MLRENSTRHMFMSVLCGRCGTVNFHLFLNLYPNFPKAMQPIGFPWTPGFQNSRKVIEYMPQKQLKSLILLIP